MSSSSRGMEDRSKESGCEHERKRVVLVTHIGCSSPVRLCTALFFMLLSTAVELSAAPGVPSSPPPDEAPLDPSILDEPLDPSILDGESDGEGAREEGSAEGEGQSPADEAGGGGLSLHTPGGRQRK